MKIAKDKKSNSLQENQKIAKSKGITLIALVITIIVLLILAGVSLSMVFNSDGLFNRANDTAKRYNKAKARETLEILLSDSQIQKYAEGLTEEQLDKKIQEIGELMDKEDPNLNIQDVIVEGHIFKIDKSVPKIIDYVGTADGIIITGNVSGNNGWIREGESVALTGTIRTYSGGRITRATIKKDEETEENLTLTGEKYTIENITTDTTYIITAEDSQGKTKTKTIQVKVKIDKTEPTVEEILLIAEAGLKMKISATGHDKDINGEEQSGIKEYRYIITSEEDPDLQGIPEKQREGIFKVGETVQIKASKGTKYKIAVKAIDNVLLESSKKEGEIETGITIAEAKKINENTIRQYIGTKVIDYDTLQGGTYRVFYYDGEDGYFGRANTIYLKKDGDITKKITLATNKVTAEGIELMKRMNPMWRDSANANSVDLTNEKGVAGLYDPKTWETYKGDESSFVIGSPSLELYMKAFNLWKTGDRDANNLICKIGSSKGYYVGTNGIYTSKYVSTDMNSLEAGPNHVFIGDSHEWIASPSGDMDTNAWIATHGSNKIGDYAVSYSHCFCPVVPLDQ